MNTDAGTLATDGLLLDKETVMPPAGAGPFRTTWPLVVLPPVALPTFTYRSLIGWTVKVPVTVTPP